MVSFRIAAKHLTLQGDFEPVDLEQVLADYQTGYTAVRELDTSDLDYYIALKCVSMLVQAQEGVEVFRNLGMLDDLCRELRRITGERVALPTSYH